MPLLAAGDVVVSPGKWTTTVTMIDVQMAGAPPAVAQAMKGRPTTMSHCITPEQARRGVRGAMRQGSGCRFTEFVAAGGRVSSRMVCERPGGSMIVVSTGTYTPTGYDMISKMTGTGRMTMTMTSRTTGRRTGPC